MPSKRYLVFPQGGGTPVVPVYNPATDVTRFRRPPQVFSSPQISVRTRAGMIANAGALSPGTQGVMVGRIAGRAALVQVASPTTPVQLIGTAVSGMETGGGDALGLNNWLAAGAMSAPNWQNWLVNVVPFASVLPAGGRPYVAINCLRIPINSCNYMGYTGISPDGGTLISGLYRSLGINDANGRPLFSAAPTGGGADPVPGHTGNEVAGDPTIYRNRVRMLATNFLAGCALAGRQGVVVLDLHWNAPRLTSTGQVLLPYFQFPALGTGDIAFFQQLAADYGQDQRFIIEIFNEQYGTGFINTTATYQEHAWLSFGGPGGPTAFSFPTPITSPSGTGGGYTYNNGGSLVLGGGQTAQTISIQQAINVFRAAGGINVMLAGCNQYTTNLSTWDFNGGSAHVADQITINGFPQLGISFHAYSPFNTTAQPLNATAAGFPFVGTEGGSYTAVGGNPKASPGFSYQLYRNNNWGYIWWSVPNTYNNVANMYPYDGRSWVNGGTALGLALPYYCPNVPVGNLGPGSSNNDTTQIPTGSN